MPETEREPLRGVFDDRDLEFLHEQLSFLDTSCDGYDSGNKAECKRLATTVRVLVHDTASSTSLMKRMGAKDVSSWAESVTVDHLRRMQRMLDEADGRVVAASVLTTYRLPPGYETDPSLIEVVPMFHAYPLGKTWMKFEPWWTKPRILDAEGGQSSRKNIVHWLANKEGGAHVDDSDARYLRLIAPGALGLNWADLPGREHSDESPIPAAMREIAEEVRFSIRGLFEQPLQVTAQRISGR